MPRKAAPTSDTPAGHTVVPRVPTATGSKITPAAEEYIRRCIQVAQMRSGHMEYVDIALQLGLGSPKEAYAMAQTGFAVMPAEDVHEGRRMSNQDLHKVGTKLWAIVENPGPLVSQGKIMWMDEEQAVPFPDAMVATRALEAIIRLEERLSRLNGWDAPKTSMIAKMPIEEVRAYLAARKAEAARHQTSGELPAT